MVSYLSTLTAPPGVKRPKQDVYNPFDGSVIEKLPIIPLTEGDEELKRAHEAFTDKSQHLTTHERLEALRKIADRVEAEREAFAELMVSEGGKPMRDTLIEVDRAIFGIRHAAACVHTVLAGEPITNQLSSAANDRKLHITREPIGVVMAISAFNHPLNLLVHQVITALAVGCPVLVKPDMRTPLTACKLVSIIHECGFAHDWCQIVLCQDGLAERLATDERVAFVSFIGSAKVGWHLRARVAPGTRMALEHGGIAPSIMLADADIDAAIPQLIKGAMTHAGQVCVSTQRLFVPQAEASQIAHKLGEAADALAVGDPMGLTTDVGPLIDHDSQKRVHKMVHDAVHDGATLITGGECMGETSYKPTILLGVSPDSTISQEEVFGPVLCIYGYDDVSQAIAQANAGRYHFQSSIWGHDPIQMHKVAEKLNASTVVINGPTTFRVDWMPFGGRDDSGLSTGGIAQSMHDYTQHKLLVW